MKTMANSDAIAVRLQKTCMAQRQCRQNISIQAITIAALPTITLWRSKAAKNQVE
jgi:hypothetical protein